MGIDGLDEYLLYALRKSLIVHRRTPKICSEIAISLVQLIDFKGARGY